LKGLFLSDIPGVQEPQIDLEMDWSRFLISRMRLIE